MSQASDRIEELKHVVEVDWAGEETARAWQKYYRLMKEHLGPVTQALVDAANPQPGMKALDLASGTGEPSIEIAQIVGPNGHVTATDLNPFMLENLRGNAADQGVTNLEAQVQDAQELAFPDDSFDLVTSRFGLMFFIEIEKALANIYRVLKPGGRVAFLVWGEPRPGTYFGSSVVPFMKRLAEKPDPEGPGPMRFALPGKLRRLVEAAGFREVSETIAMFNAPWHGDPKHLLDSMFEIATPFRHAVESLSEKDRAEATQEVLANLAPSFDGEFTTTKAPVLIILGKK